MSGIELASMIPGNVSGPLLKLRDSISFWGGLDPASGKIIDVQHADQGRSIAGNILLLPGIRGSTAAPGALLECIHAGKGPAALILAESDPTPLVAVLVAQHLGLDAFPVFSLKCVEDADRLECGQLVVIRDGLLT